MLLGGIPYRLRTDFRAGIEYAISAASGQIDVADIFAIWFEDEFPPIEYVADALDGINRFYRRKDEQLQKPETETETESNVGSGAIAYDFEQDADIIQADFQREYGIDLSTAEMHWWRFMALLDGLYSYPFKDRVRFRVQRFDGMNSKQRHNAIKMREQFAIYRGEEDNTLQGHLDYLDAIIEKHKND